MTWENGRQLASTSAAGLEAAYAYTPAGTRVSKSVNGVTTTYMLDGSMILRETVTGGGNDYMLNYAYDSLGKLVSIGYKAGAAAEVFYFVERNAQGDIIALYNSADSTKVGEYVYDSWGKLESTIPTNDPNGLLQKNPFRYRGYYYDIETGLYYLQSRYYNPEWCRFINADVFVSTGQGLLGSNMFVYCLNNPVLLEDPSGHIAQGTVHNLVVGLVAYQNNLTPNKRIDYGWEWYSPPWGYCDLASLNTGEVFEVKRDTIYKTPSQIAKRMHN
jgi:RHS repeat-associated protein